MWVVSNTHHSKDHGPSTSPGHVRDLRLTPAPHQEPGRAVNDVSTSLLMVRFYELLEAASDANLQAAAALRQAALWLRDVTAAGAMGAIKAVQRGVGLRASINSREAVVDALAQLSQMPAEARPFADPTYWAPFVLVGREG